MPCDKFMELPLEDRLPSHVTSDITDIWYNIRVNPITRDVEYQFPPSEEWVPAD